MKTKANPVCRDCGAELTGENWFPSYREGNNRICKRCVNIKCKQWKKANPEKAKAQWIRFQRKHGQRSMSENKECSYYLGVHVAERVLARTFKNVKRMPILNPGYDFICNKGYTVDVKGACLNKKGSWSFNIRRNTIADYFLCLAFNNRRDLNPIHAWLLPGSTFNHLIGIAISPSTIHKWDAYRLDISKINECCNILKEA